jgi:hypothetical protein
MSIARAIMVALTALSVTLLPVAAASASTVAHETSVAASLDCCPQAEHCDKQTKGDCGKSAECVLKCAGVSALPAAPTGVAFGPSASPPTSTLTGIATTLSLNPPSPPPRV